MALTVAGFSGLAVKGGAGIKPLVVCEASSQGRRCALAEGGDRAWYSEAELAEFEERGLVTLLSATQSYRQGDVALYAHLAFVAPDGATDQLPLSVDERFMLYRKPESFVAVVALDDAQAQLQQWAQRLLTHARQTLQRHVLPRGERGALLYAEAMRARLALAGLQSEGARSARLDAFAAACAGLQLQGAATEAFEADALLDFEQGEVVRHALQNWHSGVVPSPRTRVDCGEVQGPHQLWLEVA